MSSSPVEQNAVEAKRPEIGLFFAIKNLASQLSRALCARSFFSLRLCRINGSVFEKYLRIGVWFQLSDLHHESFALLFFALAIGILIGSFIPRKRTRPG
jgi:hypothetical protein